MATAKTTTLTFCIEPGLKEGRTAAAREHRSIANRVAVLIQNHCAQQGIPVEETPQLWVAQGLRTRPLRTR